MKGLSLFQREMYIYGLYHRTRAIIQSLFPFISPSLGVPEAAPSAAHEPVRGALQLQVTPPGRTRSQVSPLVHLLGF